MTRDRAVVGIDLAWGDRGRSGVVVLADGRLRSSTVTSDDEIVATVPAGPVVVAFDAPLRVPNLTGRRPCDAAISRCFARYHAGAYPANRSLPWLAEPRAARLAERLGLAVDGDPERLAIEVYPHAATVVLFELDRVLPYKRRRGRDLESRRGAFRSLTEAIASLAEASPALPLASSDRWETLLRAVERAGSGADLDRIEDELDAHLCAYVGLLFDTAPSRCDIVGVPREGAIVVPASARTSACLSA